MHNSPRLWILPIGVFQVAPFCIQKADETCVEKEIQESEENNCLVSCTGLYADIVHGSDISSKGREILASLEDEYFQYETSFAKNIAFDPTSEDLSMY